MKAKNMTTLENLSVFCHGSGIITIFLGIIVILLDISRKDYTHIQIGFFILITGYAFVKISVKLSKIVLEEKKFGL